MSIGETIGVTRPFTDASQSIHWSISWKNGRMGARRSKKENPHQFIIHGEGIFLSGPLYRSLSQHITLSISPDKCQSKGLSPGFFFFFFFALEDFRDKSQWVHSDGGLETMVT